MAVHSDRSSTRRYALLLSVTVALSAGCVVDATPTVIALPSASAEVTSGGAVPSLIALPSFGPFVATPPGDRYVEGTLEFINWLVACAAENGEVVKALPGNPPALHILGTRARTGDIVDQCRLTGLDEGWIVPSPFDGSREGYRLMFRLWLPVHECLRENGYPTVDPSSKDAFVDHGPSIWNPYAGMGGAPLVVVDPTTAPARDREQLEAQALCGASAETLYQEQLQRQGEEGG